MKKLLTVLAALPLLANAQDAKNNPGKKIAVGVSFSPDHSYRTLKNNDGSSSGEMIIDIRNDIEKAKVGYTTGIILNIPVTGKLEIQTGVLYSGKGYKTPKQATVFPIPGPGQPTHYESKSRFSYIDIPFKLNFITGAGKIKFIAGAGLSGGYLLSKSEIITFIYADGTRKKYDQYPDHDYNKFSLTSVISTGVEFKLKENITLRAEPTFRYGLLKIIDEPVSARLWNVGLNMGVNMQFKKRE